MPVFEYTASDQSGALTKGELEAKDKAAATRALVSRGLFVLEIKKSKKVSETTRPPIPKPSPSPKVSAPVPKRRQALPEPSVVPKKESSKRSRVRWPALQQALYLRQLHVLFGAGIPIHQATFILGDSEEHPPAVKAILIEVPRDLERGRLLSKSLERTGLFGKLVTASVRLGEESGKLSEVLSHLAEAKEQSVKLKRTLVAKLTYPVIVLILMSLGLVVMGHIMSRVMSSIPSFKASDVPLFGLLNDILSNGAFLPGTLLALAATVFLARYFWLTPDLRVLVEERLFGIPVAGGLLKRIEAHTVTSQLNLLLAAGLPVVRGMELCAELVWTESFRRAIQNSRKELLDGAELAESFRFAGLFPQDVLALLTAGEASGAMEKSLSKASEYCADQVERTLESLLALIEPLLIGFLGIAIGAVLLCTFVPVFNSLQTL